ncbi:MAG: hypothetical protein B5M53_00410 [Candidatus Cloacimonas sp. 4484_209]|nr:MAG: hypothetical protein B5M53_00410 [Candidatus Cloacimonas sp. 4484_209]
MKNRKIISSIFIEIVICSLVLVFLSEVKADQEVTFSDKNLEEVIREEIGKSSGPIYTSDLEEITHLWASYEDIEDLNGLEHCVNLRQLYLAGNNIYDISSLANLTNLTYLDLGGNNISNISPLSDLVNLEHLELGGNNISDISPLSNLINLTFLRLVSNNISNISSFSNLINLTYLNLNNNDISDVSPLSDLNNLEDLHLRDNDISDISSLVENIDIKKLKILDVGKNILNFDSVTKYIPELQNRGITVYYSNHFLYIGIFVAIIISILAIYMIIKRKAKGEELEPKEKPKSKHPEKKVSLRMNYLLKEKEDLRKKLDELKSEKNRLISQKIMTERIYKDRYEEIMDQLVDIEDKIIQEKMKGGGKK